MNRAPAPTDFWWAEHQKTCGGTYTKVREPDGYGEKKKKKEETESQPGIIYILYNELLHCCLNIVF